MNYPFPCLTRDRRGIDRFLYVSLIQPALRRSSTGQDSSNMIIMIMKNEDFNCPIPLNDADCVLMAHGGGGRMTHQLISNIFYPAFRNPLLEQDPRWLHFPFRKGVWHVRPTLRGRPDFFRRRYRRPGGERDGERPCLRCPSAFTSLPGSYSKRLACRPATHRAVHEEVRPTKPACRLSPVIPRWWNVANATNSLSIPAASESPKASASPRPRNKPGDAVICSNIGAHGITILSARESRIRNKSEK